METFIMAEVVMRNRNSSYNKEVTDFLERNIESIVTYGRVKLDITVLDDNQLQEIKDKGVKKLPCIIMKKNDKFKIVQSAKEIISTLITIVKRSKTAVKPKSDDDLLQEYTNSAVYEGVTMVGKEVKCVSNDDGSNDESKDQFEKRCREFEAKRERSHLANTVKNPHETNMKNRANANNNGDQRQPASALKIFQPSQTNYVDTRAQTTMNTRSDNVGGDGEDPRFNRIMDERLNTSAYSSSNTGIDSIDNRLLPNNATLSKDDDLLKFMFDKGGNGSGFY